MGMVAQIVGGGSITLVKKAAVGLVPRVQAFSTRLLELVRVNRAVHMPTYNMLIQEAAQQEEQRAARAATRQTLIRETVTASREVISLLQRWQIRRNAAARR